MVFDFNVALDGAWQYPEKRSVGKNIPKKKNGEEKGRKMLAMRASSRKCKKKYGSYARRRAAIFFFQSFGKTVTLWYTIFTKYLRGWV